MMIKCKEASQLISRGIDNNLSFRERFALKTHLFICKYCMRISQQFKNINIAINNMHKNIEGDTNIELPSEAKDRIAKSIESQN